MRRSASGMLGAIAVAALFVAGGCDSSVDVRGPRFTLPTVPATPSTPTGEMVTESRPIAGVNGVALQAVGYVDIDFGPMESLTITAPARVMPLLTSEVVGGRLLLGRESSSYQGQASDIQYEIGLRQLDELSLEGVGRLSADGVDSRIFSVRLNGVGDITASGRAERQEVQLAGVGGYYAALLESRVTHVEISSGRAVVWATERLEGFVGFGCILEYRGSPTLAVSGGGTVRPIDFNP